MAGCVCVLCASPVSPNRFDLMNQSTFNPYLFYTFLKLFELTRRSVTQLLFNNNDKKKICDVNDITASLINKELSFLKVFWQIDFKEKLNIPMG